MRLKILGVDPSLRGFGMAQLILDVETLEFTLHDLILVKTEAQVTKMTRRNSDDLRRAKELHDSFQHACRDFAADFVFSEVPTGSQSARANISFGMMIGILASAPCPVVQVMPLETKLAVTGKKTASKEEIITWATTKYPDAPWLRARGKANGALVDANEHLADACAVAQAGILTEEFRRMTTMLRAQNRTA